MYKIYKLSMKSKQSTLKINNKKRIIIFRILYFSLDQTRLQNMTIFIEMIAGTKKKSTKMYQLQTKTI